LVPASPVTFSVFALDGLGAIPLSLQIPREQGLGSPIQIIKVFGNDRPQAIGIDPGYSWRSMLPSPWMSFHGTSGRAFFRSSGMCLVASETINSAC
jgi:hypothetical protein